MTMPDTFYEGTNWQQSSEPHTIVDVQESDCWPVDDRSGSGTKDQLDDNLHPIIAIGGRTAADGRPLNLTGVVVSVNLSVLGTATDRVEVNIADGTIVRQYVANVLTYSEGTAATFEQAPVTDEDNKDIQKELLEACWQNGLNYAQFLPIFIQVVIEEDDITAFEALTVIENLDHLPSDKVLEEQLDLINSKIGELGQTKAYYLNVIKEFIEKQLD